MTRASFIAIAALLTGCASLAGDPAKMSADQLKASAKDKNAAVACWNGKTAAGNVTTVYVNADQAPKIGSKVTIEADCKTTVTTTSEKP